MYFPKNPFNDRVSQDGTRSSGEMKLTCHTADTASALKRPILEEPVSSIVGSKTHVRSQKATRQFHKSTRCFILPASKNATASVASLRLHEIATVFLPSVASTYDSASAEMPLTMPASATNAHTAIIGEATKKVAGTKYSSRAPKLGCDCM